MSLCFHVSFWTNEILTTIFLFTTPGSHRIPLSVLYVSKFWDVSSSSRFGLWQFAKNVITVLSLLFFVCFCIVHMCSVFFPFLSLFPFMIMQYKLSFFLCVHNGRTWPITETLFYVSIFCKSFASSFSVSIFISMSILFPNSITSYSVPFFVSFTNFHGMRELVTSTFIFSMF